VWPDAGQRNAGDLGSSDADHPLHRLPGSPLEAINI
jgi:hypothetical protein